MNLMPAPRHRPCLILTACMAGWTAWVQHDPFFWDTVQLGSKHAHHFYENGLQWTALPSEIDSGHPPVFGYYLALVWTLFGKTLPASHWAMFPFLAGIAILLYRLGEQAGGKGWGCVLALLAILDPVLAGQSALIGPDVPLAFFFLLAVFSLINKHSALAAVAILGLCAISMRGMMTAAGLFAWQLAVQGVQTHKIPDPLRPGLVFLPGAMFAAWFLWWHQNATGWTGFHAGSPWAAAFEPVSGAGFLKNILVLGWRWVDLGRFIEWMVLGALLVQWRRKKTGDNTWTRWALLLAALVLFLSPSALLYRNLSAHRYFLPAFLAMHLLVIHLLGHFDLRSLWRKSVLTALFLGLGTGNCWIYPRGISMDWDSTLAHRPYHRLRAEMLAYIEKEKIPFSGIGTAFPNVNYGEHLLLNGDRRTFSEKNYLKNEYILASNVFNDFSETDYEVLQREWLPVNKLEHCGVWLVLYRKH